MRILVSVLLASMLASEARADDSDEAWDFPELYGQPTPAPVDERWDRQIEATPRPAPVRRSPARPPGSIGVGVIVGAPTGLAGKFLLGPSAAVDAAFAMDDGIYYFHGDYVLMQQTLARGSAGAVRWFIGGGARVLLVEEESGARTRSVSMAAGNGNGNGNGGNGSGGSGGSSSGVSRGEASSNVHLGARVPVGLAARFARTPRLELFGELALDVGVLGDEGSNLTGSVGARWFF